MEWKIFSENPQALKPVPIRELISRSYFGPEDGSTIADLYACSILPFKAKAGPGTTRYTFLLDRPFGAKAILGFANRQAWFRNDLLHLPAAHADIEDIDKVDQRHKGLIDLGYLDNAQKAEFKRLGLNLEIYLEGLPLEKINDETFLRFKLLVLNRLVNGNGQMTRHRLKMGLMLYGKENQPAHFSLVSNKKNIYEFNFQELIGYLKQYPILKDVPFYFGTLDRSWINAMNTAMVVPALIIDHDREGFHLRQVNTNPHIEDTASHIIRSRVMNGYDIRHGELKFFRNNNTNAMSGPITLGLLDSHFFRLIQDLRKLNSKGERSDSPRAQKIMAIQSVLAGHTVFDHRIKGMVAKLEDVPLFNNLLSRVTG